MGSTKSESMSIVDEFSSTEGTGSLDEGIKESLISTFSSAELGLEDDSINFPWPRKNPVIPGIQNLSGSVPKFERTCHCQGYPYSSEHKAHALVFWTEPGGVRRSRDIF